MYSKKCKICGREIPPNERGCVRANAAYCSDECRKRGASISCAKSISRRRKVDEEFRLKRNNTSKLFNRKKREKEKEAKYKRVAEKVLTDISNGGDAESVAVILMNELGRKKRGIDA